MSDPAVRRSWEAFKRWSDAVTREGDVTLTVNRTDAGEAADALAAIAFRDREWPMEGVDREACEQAVARVWRELRRVVDHRTPEQQRLFQEFLEAERALDI